MKIYVCVETKAARPVQKHMNELVEGRFVDAETSLLTSGMQPYNKIARIGAGVEKQDSMLAEQSKLEK